MTPCVKLLEVKCNTCMYTFFHTLNAICLQHDNATALSSQPSQKFYNKKRKKLKKSSWTWYTAVKRTHTFFFFLSSFLFVFCFELSKGWRVEKSRCTVWQETKPESFHARENWYPKLYSCLVPSFHSVWENFISCPFHKLSWQEKHFFLLHEFSIG